MFFSINAPFYFRTARHPFSSSMQYPHFHDRYELYFLLEGNKGYDVAGAALSLKADSLLLINRGVLHRAYSSDNAPHRMAVLNFSTAFMERFAGCPALESLSRPFDCRLAVLPGGLRTWRDRLLEELAGWTGAHGQPLEGTDPVLLQCRVYELLAQLEQLRGTSGWQELVPQGSSSLDAVLQIVKYIYDHYSQPLRLDELARQFGYGEGYLSQQLRRYLGMTFTQYLAAVRLEEACRLLESTPWPVGRIAEAVGYGSAAYFADCFARRTGRSPTAYRLERRG